MRFGTSHVVSGSLLVAIGACLSIGLSGCAEVPDEGVEDPEDSIFVDDSKADDFYSLSAQEYLLEGKSTVVLDASMADRPAAERLEAATQLVGLKQIAIAWFITQYLVDKEHDDPNASFGGFGGMAKAGAYEDLAITERADKVTFDFTFRQIAAGGKNLMSKLPTRLVGGKHVFDLEIGRPTNEELAQLETNAEWYRNAPWSPWNPANVAADKKEPITFSITRERPSTDGFFDLARLTADGKLDMDVYFGWDYHSEYHLKHSKQFFTWLKNQGFRAPVASWDQLTPTTGPFTRTVKADGRSVTVEVRMYFGKPGTATDPDTDEGGRVLEGLAMESLARRDVIIYSGHSGPFYGFALANWKKTAEGDLDDDDMRAAPMPSDRYQVVLAEGCDTYQIGTAFKENPNKLGKNVDVITTTSFSDASSPAAVQNFIAALLARDSLQRLRPQPVSTLLTKLDGESWGFTTMYGMHGIDDNPTVVPWARVADFGKRCRVNADCGGPGNLCVGTASTGRTCTAACVANAGCGVGYTCKLVASSSSSTIYGRACAPTRR
ncbi:MAG: hypothetical protein F9K40_21365 [Kofleriaceae bacterium]|nr:MAG: hypothetical protein F9K40_21365 [Kofleriaceae bacterium]MBZ0231514.1 hypothetical protein [Kofleriaceae bacterium]